MVKIDRLWQGVPSQLVVQLFRYLVAGSIAFAVDFMTLYLLTNFCGLHYMYSQLVSYTVGLVITYLFSILWVYDKRKTTKVAVEFSLFATIGVVGIVLTTVLMFLLTEYMSLHYLASKVVTTILVMLWNFTARKYILFN